MNYKLIIPFIAALAFASCAKKEETVVPVRVAYDARFQKEFIPGVRFSPAVTEEKYLRLNQIPAEVANGYDSHLDASDIVFLINSGEAPISAAEANVYARQNLDAGGIAAVVRCEVTHPGRLGLDTVHTSPARITSAEVYQLTSTNMTLSMRFSDEYFDGEQICTLVQAAEARGQRKELVSLVDGYDGSFTTEDVVTLFDAMVSAHEANHWKTLEEKYGVPISGEDIVSYLEKGFNFLEVEVEARREFIRRSFESDGVPIMLEIKAVEED